MSLYKIVLLSVLIVFSILQSLEDLRRMRINNRLQWLSILVAVVVHLIFNWRGIWIYLVSSLIFGIFYYIVRMISKRNLGIGDVYFGLFQGMLLVPRALPICVALESILALVIMRRKVGRVAFPFIPFMSVGLLVSFLIY